MAIKTYRITGAFRQNRKVQPFSIDARGLNEDTARDKAFKELGSKHKLKRRDINIDSVTEVTAKDSKSLVIQQIGGE